VGGKKPVPLDIRVLATSNRDMAEEVKQGGFREDLYYRLNVFPLEIPALRQRPGDIVPLARHFISVHGGRAGRSARLSDAAAAKLAAHAWPGNVRELENVIQRALILAPGETIEAEHLLFAAGAALPVTIVAAPTSAATQGAPGAGESQASMRDLERQHILDTLTAVGGSRRLAVERLGLSERTLRYKLKQYRDEGYL
jgi:two-component system response regulator FlrC